MAHRRLHCRILMTLVVGMLFSALPQGAIIAAEKPTTLRVRKDQLRYAGKSFLHWREQMLTELMPKIRIQSMRVLVVFAQHGYAAETTEALLEMARGFDTLLEMDESGYKESTAGDGLSLRDDHEPDDGDVWDAGLNTVEKIGPAALPLLRGGVKDESRAVRLFALRGLGRLGRIAREAVPDVAATCGGRDSTLRLVALDTLGKIAAKDRKALSPLRTALGDKEEAVRCAALDALRKLGPDLAGRARADILEALKDPVAGVRSKAVWALKGSGIGAKELSALLKVTQDQDAEVQDNAYRCLQQLGPKAREAVPELIARLKTLSKADAKKDDRRIPGARVNIPGMREEVFISEPYDELAAVVATLGAIGPDARDALPLLHKLLERADAAQKEKITEAIRAIRGDRPSHRLTGPPS